MSDAVDLELIEKWIRVRGPQTHPHTREHVLAMVAEIRELRAAAGVNEQIRLMQRDEIERLYARLQTENPIASEKPDAAEWRE